MSRETWLLQLQAPAQACPARWFSDDQSSSQIPTSPFSRHRPHSTFVIELFLLTHPPLPLSRFAVNILSTAVDYGHWFSAGQAFLVRGCSQFELFLEPDRFWIALHRSHQIFRRKNSAARQHVSAKHGNATRQSLFSCRVLAKERPALGGPRGIIPSSLVGFVAFVRGDP